VNGSANIHGDNFTGTPPSGEVENGMFGAGPRYQESAFWFDAFDTWLGCQNPGPADCQLTANGYQYDPISGNSVLKVQQTFYAPPCPALQDCEMEQYHFSGHFRNLTALQILATVEGGNTLISWYMDDVSLSWTNKTCAATMLRDEAAAEF
jgi:hypothetical protein